MKRVQNQIGFLPNEIREKSDDRIVIVENISVWQRIYAILTGIFILFISFNASLPFPGSVIQLLFLVVGAYIIFWGIRMLLIGYSVTIDKKSHRIIIKKDSNINLLKSIIEMPFLDMDRIEIKRHADSESDDTWSVNLMKFKGDSIQIYVTYYKLDAEMLAENLSKITHKEIIQSGKSKYDSQAHKVPFK